MSKTKKRSRFLIVARMFVGLMVFNIVASFFLAFFSSNIGLIIRLSPFVYAYAATVTVLGAAWVARGTGYLLFRVLLLSLSIGSNLVLEQGLFGFWITSPGWWQNMVFYYSLLSAMTIAACSLWWVVYQLYRSRSGVDPWQFSLQKLLILSACVALLAAICRWLAAAGVADLFPGSEAEWYELLSGNFAMVLIVLPPGAMVARRSGFLSRVLLPILVGLAVGIAFVLLISGTDFLAPILSFTFCMSVVVVLVENYLRWRGATILGPIHPVHHGGAEVTEREKKEEINDRAQP
jgi:hypothetical protein